MRLVIVLRHGPANRAYGQGFPLAGARNGVLVANVREQADRGICLRTGPSQVGPFVVAAENRGPQARDDETAPDADEGV